MKTNIHFICKPLSYVTAVMYRVAVYDAQDDLSLVANTKMWEAAK
jgi:hypothetical protein